ncbi:MAG: hypothetical protein WBH66_06715, partial [Rectinemataceae bacterium]
MIGEQNLSSSLSFAAPPYWLGLASEDWRSCHRDSRGVPVDPILAQTLPSPAENNSLHLEAKDPLNESAYSP